MAKKSIKRVTDENYVKSAVMTEFGASDRKILGCTMFDGRHTVGTDTHRLHWITNLSTVEGEPVYTPVSRDSKVEGMPLAWKRVTPDVDTMKWVVDVEILHLQNAINAMRQFGPYDNRCRVQLQSVENGRFLTWRLNLLGLGGSQFDSNYGVGQCNISHIPIKMVKAPSNENMFETAFNVNYLWDAIQGIPWMREHKIAADYAIRLHFHSVARPVIIQHQQETGCIELPLRQAVIMPMALH